MSSPNAESRTQLFALVATAVIVVVLSILAGSQPDATPVVEPSALLLGDGGGRALFLAAEELGLEPQIWMRSLRDLEETPPRGLLVLLAPTAAVEDEEVGVLLRWIDAGGNLFYAPPLPGWRATSSDDPLLAALAIERRSNDAGEQHPVTTGDPLARALLEECAANLPDFEWTLAAADSGVQEFVPLLQNSAGQPGAALLRRERGTVLLFSDVSALSNGRIGKADAVLLALRSLAALSHEGPLLFDEFHHGFDETGGAFGATRRWLARTPVGHALLALFLVGLAALIVAGIRLGRPIPPAPTPVRSVLEHVAALASAWQRVPAGRREQELLLEGLRLRLGGRIDGPRLEQMTRARPHLAASTATIAGALAAPQTKSTIPTADALELAAAIDAVLAEREGLLVTES